MFHVDRERNLVPALEWIISNHLRNEADSNIDWERFRYSNIDGADLIRSTLKDVF